ncbi:hypothetical protein RCOM_1959270, partial [Ricinus communis]
MGTRQQEQPGHWSPIIHAIVFCLAAIAVVADKPYIYASPPPPHHPKDYASPPYYYKSPPPKHAEHPPYYYKSPPPPPKH